MRRPGARGRSPHSIPLSRPGGPAPSLPMCGEHVSAAQLDCSGWGACQYQGERTLRSRVCEAGRRHLEGHLQTRSVQTRVCKGVGLACVHGGSDLCWMSHCSVGVIVMGRELAVAPGPGASVRLACSGLTAN